MSIRKLTASDIDELFGLITKMVSEAEFSQAAPEVKKIRKMFDLPNTAAFGAFQNDKMIGFIAGIYGEYFFSCKKRVADLGFYVLPENRGSKEAIRLIKELESWAKSLNVDDLCLGQTTAVNIEKTQKFYEKMGYKTVGFNTVKHLRN